MAAKKKAKKRSGAKKSARPKKAARKSTSKKPARKAAPKKSPRKAASRKPARRPAPAKRKSPMQRMTSVAKQVALRFRHEPGALRHTERQRRVVGQRPLQRCAQVVVLQGNAVEQGTAGG